MNYLLLAAGVLCALLAFVCIVFCIQFWINSTEDEAESITKMRRRIIVGTGVGFLVTTYLAWRIYSYLFLTDLGVLEFFGLWYIGGGVSRFLVLVKRHEVLSPHFTTDLDEVFQIIFWALCGPLVTIHLIHVLFFEKNWFD